MKHSKTAERNFSQVVDLVYNLPIEEKEELQKLLEHNLSEVRRERIARNYKAALKEEKSGKLKFSSSVEALKKSL